MVPGDGGLQERCRPKRWTWRHLFYIKKVAINSCVFGLINELLQCCDLVSWKNCFQVVLAGCKEGFFNPLTSLPRIPKLQCHRCHRKPNSPVVVNTFVPRPTLTTQYGMRSYPWFASKPVPSLPSHNPQDPAAHDPVQSREPSPGPGMVPVPDHKPWTRNAPWKVGLPCPSQPFLPCPFKYIFSEEHHLIQL